jgi:hypothetical protein
MAIGRVLSNQQNIETSNLLRKRVLSGVRVTVSGLILVTGLHLSLNRISQIRHPYQMVKNGWERPNSESISQVINSWGEGPIVYFRFAKNPETGTFPSIGEDRILNFWSPAFFSPHGSYGIFWNWAYSGLVSNDPSVLCEPTRSASVTVVTRDVLLEQQVLTACGATQTKFEVLVN